MTEQATSTARARPTGRGPTCCGGCTAGRTYVLFVLRELSSLFVAWFVVYLVLLVAAVHGCSGSYERFLGWSSRP
jgi:hypothetical protein